MTLAIGQTVYGTNPHLGGAFVGKVEELAPDLSCTDDETLELLEGKVLVRIDGQLPACWWIDPSDLQVRQ